MFFFSICTNILYVIQLLLDQFSSINNEKLLYSRDRFFLLQQGMMLFQLDFKFFFWRNFIIDWKMEMHM